MCHTLAKALKCESQLKYLVLKHLINITIFSNLSNHKDMPFNQYELLKYMLKHSHEWALFLNRIVR